MEWSSHEPYAIARLRKVFIIRFTIDVDTPEEGPDVTLTEARYIDMTKGGLVKVKRYGRKVDLVNHARDFQEAGRSVMECNHEDVRSKLEIVRISEGFINT